MKLTKPQQQSLKRIWLRHITRKRSDNPLYFRDGFEPHTSYLSTRRRVSAYPDRSGCVGIVIGLMYIGIETDGYTHT